ncbi:inosine monophosphate dehydrogenase [Mytilinidion resinicola]|uniref:Inosine monophosphate dehydrogenase n=1 Tax=Mytilinidion resinicola TaxID=574789 RepID=A0A6A6YEK7_9PEZI|nr:inosine monophosphate dehydrogenase [Mytilinidion resinicola]KAF2807256.1 inosine monophosphate dehydrogenase [Mytilinidion resinicola]
MASLRSSLPWTKLPLIINAPMANFAGGDLAAAVTGAGGLGTIGTMFDMDVLKANLNTASKLLQRGNIPRFNGTLPVGVSFLTFASKLGPATPVIEEFKPAVVWLFGAIELDDYVVWAKAVREVSPASKIWIQCGSVASALHIAKSSALDVLVVQGADAGGHGYEKSAGIISLLPEAADALAKAGFGHIPLVAAGGIADGRGVAAAQALGAKGIVMGTRFLAARETTVPPNYQTAVLKATDGSQSTVRAKVFDELKGPNVWPAVYDGRSIVTESYTDHVKGVGIEEIRKLHAEAVKKEDGGYGEKARAAIWAGTGVGLVTEVMDAADIIEQVRSQAQKICKEFSS